MCPPPWCHTVQPHPRTASRLSLAALQAQPGTWMGKELGSCVLSCTQHAARRPYPNWRWWPLCAAWDLRKIYVPSELVALTRKGEIET